jgi:hypothetical protein
MDVARAVVRLLYNYALTPHLEGKNSNSRHRQPRSLCFQSSRIKLCLLHSHVLQSFDIQLQLPRIQSLSAFFYPKLASYRVNSISTTHNKKDEVAGYCTHTSGSCVKILVK